jgi:uncharacterized membrane protein
VNDIARLPLVAPWRWIQAGWDDFRASWPASLFYGFVFAGMGRALSRVFANAYEYVWALTSGFLLVGPFLALGLYDLSRRRERGQPLNLRPTLLAWRPNRASLGIFSLVLGVLLLLWSRASLVVVAVSFPDQLPSLGAFLDEATGSIQHLQFLAAYCVVGGVFASLVFGISVVSVPMMLDRDTDGIVAALTSVRSCLENPGVMAWWACLITLLTAAGFLTSHLGLIVTTPLIGHATWHAYRETVLPAP